MNQVTLIGRLTKDPILRFTKTKEALAIANFSLAVQKRFKKDEADFLNCVVFGKTAEIIHQHFHKGNQIAIIGELKTGSYEKDGQKHYTTDIVVERFYFIGNKSDNSGETKKAEQQQNYPDYIQQNVTDDDDLPF